MWRLKKQLQVGDRVYFKRDAVIFDDELEEMITTLGHKDPEYIWSSCIIGFNGPDTIIVDFGHDVVVFVDIKKVW